MRRHANEVQAPIANANQSIESVRKPARGKKMIQEHTKPTTRALLLNLSLCQHAVQCVCEGDVSTSQICFKFHVVDNGCAGRHWS